MDREFSACSVEELPQVTDGAHENASALTDGVVKEVQNPMQQADTWPCKELQERTSVPKNQVVMNNLQQNAAVCADANKSLIGEAGLEPARGINPRGF